MATDSLKSTWANRVLQIGVMSFLNGSKQNFAFSFLIPRNISVPNWGNIGKETKELQKMRNGVIMMSFLKIAQ